MHLSNFNPQNNIDIKKMHISPSWHFGVVAVSIFVVETLVMVILANLPTIPEIATYFLDSLMLLIFMAPLLYYFVSRPLVLTISEYRTIEQKLINYKDNLEILVEERTTALSTLVSELEREIVERKKAENALRESEVPFRQIFEQSEDAVIIFVASDCLIKDVNPATEKMFKYLNTELTGQNIRFVLDDSVVVEACERLCPNVSGKETVVFDRLNMVRRDGTVFVASVRCKLITLQGKNVIYSSFRDITDKIKLEEDARILQAKMIHANKMTSLGLLVASVAHEINNPNSFIMINSQSLTRTWQNILPILDMQYAEKGDFIVGEVMYSQARDMFPEFYRGITEGSRRINEIVSNLKKFVREDNQTPESKVDINRVVTVSMSILGHQIRKYTDVFHENLAENLPEIHGSPLQLEQVIMNLIMNSLQSLLNRKSGVWISTNYNYDSDSVTIMIRDEGCGIPAETGVRIFEPFFTTHGATGGTGLGLSISRSIVNDHRGTIEFSSEPGRGTEFILSFPCG